jgi:tRNA(Ile)-lysidine synthase
MKSMNQSNGIIRPFLDEFRSELEHWASQWELHPREDSSNLKSDYLRNRIRHEVLPLLEELRPGTSRHLARTASRLQPLSDEMKRSIDQAQSRCTKVQLDAIELDLKCWRQEPLRAEVLYALARHFNVSSKAVAEINALTAQDVESGSKFASNTVVVMRAKTSLVWTPQIAKT